MAPFSQAWNVRLRSLSNDSLAVIAPKDDRMTDFLERAA
jgi:hypothetical protein